MYCVMCHGRGLDQNDHICPRCQGTGIEPEGPVPVIGLCGSETDLIMAVSS